MEIISSGSKGGGGGGGLGWAIAPPPPPPPQISILCMGVLGDSTAVHQVVNYVHVCFIDGREHGRTI